ncbi:hypothetical protein [Roseivivax halodurans]|nr:hypothetical protein [Roseivivax halodurans]
MRMFLPREAEFRSLEDGSVLQILAPIPGDVVLVDLLTHDGTMPRKHTDWCGY